MLIKMHERPKDCQEEIDYIVQFGSLNQLTHPEEQIDSAVKKYGATPVLEALYRWINTSKAERLVRYMKKWRV